MPTRCGSVCILTMSGWQGRQSQKQQCAGDGLIGRVGFRYQWARLPENGLGKLHSGHLCQLSSNSRGGSHDWSPRCAISREKRIGCGVSSGKAAPLVPTRSADVWPQVVQTVWRASKVQTMWRAMPSAPTVDRIRFTLLPGARGIPKCTFQFAVDAHVLAST